MGLPFSLELAHGHAVFIRPTVGGGALDVYVSFRLKNLIRWVHFRGETEPQRG